MIWLQLSAVGCSSDRCSKSCRANLCPFSGSRNILQQLRVLLLMLLLLRRQQISNEKNLHLVCLSIWINVAAFVVLLLVQFCVSVSVMSVRHFLLLSELVCTDLWTSISLPLICVSLFVCAFVQFSNFVCTFLNKSLNGRICLSHTTIVLCLSACAYLKYFLSLFLLCLYISVLFSVIVKLILIAI